MSVRKVLSIASFALITLVGVSMLSGCHGRRHRDVDPEKAYKFVSWQVDEALDELEANQDQRVQIHEVKDKVFDEAIDLRDTSRVHRKVLLDQLMSETPDRKKMHAEVDAWIDELRAAAHVAVDASVDVHGILDAKQREKVFERMREHMDP